MGFREGEDGVVLSNQTPKQHTTSSCTLSATYVPLSAHVDKTNDCSIAATHLEAPALKSRGSQLAEVILLRLFFGLDLLPLRRSEAIRDVDHLKTCYDNIQEVKGVGGGGRRGVSFRGKSKQGLAKVITTWVDDL